MNIYLHTILSTTAMGAFGSLAGFAAIDNPRRCSPSVSRSIGHVFVARVALVGLVSLSPLGQSAIVSVSAPYFGDTHVPARHLGHCRLVAIRGLWEVRVLGLGWVLGLGLGWRCCGPVAWECCVGVGMDKNNGRHSFVRSRRFVHVSARIRSRPLMWVVCVLCVFARICLRVHMFICAWLRVYALVCACLRRRAGQTAAKTMQVLGVH